MDADTFLAEVDALRSQGMSWPAIGQHLNTTAETVRSRYRRLKLQVDNTPYPDELNNIDMDIDAARVLFPDKKLQEKVDWRELIELAQVGQAINARMDDEQRTATVEIKTDKPVAIMFSGDWHLGDGAVDYKNWSSMMKTLLDDERLYLVDLGDDIQNMRVFKTLAGIFGQVLTPVQQAQLLKSVADELTAKNKLLAKIGGNHDLEFDERIFGQALQKYLLTQMKAPRFANRGLVRLTVGQQEYTLLLFHKSRFRSYLRPTHGNLREYQLSYPADIVAGAHDHTPGLEVLWGYQLARDAGKEFGGETILIKCGSYQDGGYGWRYFHNSVKADPTVVFFPNEHRKVAFMNPVDALEYLKGVSNA